MNITFNYTRDIYYLNHKLINMGQFLGADMYLYCPTPFAPPLYCPTPILFPILKYYRDLSTYHLDIGKTLLAKNNFQKYLSLMMN